MPHARTFALPAICAVTLITVGCGTKATHNPWHNAAMYGGQAQLQAALDRGASINAKNSDNNTPLHEAAERGNIAAVNFLIEHGADLNARDEDGDTPLHFAADDNQHQVVDALLKAGAVPDPVNEDLETPLFLAAEEGQTESVQLLLASHGVEPNRKNDEGITPGMIARSKGYGAVADMIDRRGAAPAPAASPVNPLAK